MTTVDFVAYGDPVPQGSKIPVVNWKTRKVWLRDDNAHDLDKWRGIVAAAGQALMIESDTNGTRPALDGPLAASVVFTVARPAAAAKRRWPAVRPDLDKLLRAVLDALKTGGVIHDDSRVVILEQLAKVYIGFCPIELPVAAVLTRPGAWIRVRTLDPDQEELPL